MVRAFLALWLVGGAATIGSARAEEKQLRRPAAAPSPQSDVSTHDWSGFHVGVTGGLARLREPSAAPDLSRPGLPGR